MLQVESMTETLRWCAASVLMAAFLVAAIGNIIVVIRSFFNPKVPSTVPLIGGIAGAASVLLAPIEGSNTLFWIPLVADVACVPMVVYTPFWLMRHRKQSRKR